MAAESTQGEMRQPHAPPFWSVMIPSYKPSQHLRETLEAVRAARDVCGASMQIEVVDDASPDCDVSALISSWGIEDIAVHRRPVNGGLAACWNECIARACGTWVHLLHQDDLVSPEFYVRMNQASAEWPDAGMLFCRNIFIFGTELRLADLLQPQAGPISDWLLGLCTRQVVQCPSVAVRRGVYGRLGGFDPSLQYIIDWEMWIRIAAATQVVYLPEALASYRVHSNTESKRLRASGKLVEDLARGVEKIRNTVLTAGRPDCAAAALRYAWTVSGEVAWEACFAERLPEAVQELRASLRHFGRRVGIRELIPRLRWYVSLRRRMASGRGAVA